MWHGSTHTVTGARPHMHCMGPPVLACHARSMLCAPAARSDYARGGKWRGVCDAYPTRAAGRVRCCGSACRFVGLSRLRGIKLRPGTRVTQWCSPLPPRLLCTHEQRCAFVNGSAKAGLQQAQRQLARSTIGACARTSVGMAPATIYQYSPGPQYKSGML